MDNVTPLYDIILILKYYLSETSRSVECLYPWQEKLSYILRTDIQFAAAVLCTCSPSAHAEVVTRGSWGLMVSQHSLASKPQVTETISEEHNTSLTFEPPQVYIHTGPKINRTMHTHKNKLVK